MPGRKKRRALVWAEVYPYLFGPRRLELLARGELRTWLGVRWVRPRGQA